MGRTARPLHHRQAPRNDAAFALSLQMHDSALQVLARTYQMLAYIARGHSHVQQRLNRAQAGGSVEARGTRWVADGCRAFVPQDGLLEEVAPIPDTRRRSSRVPRPSGREVEVTSSIELSPPLQRRTPSASLWWPRSRTRATRNTAANASAHARRTATLMMRGKTHGTARVWLGGALRLEGGLLRGEEAQRLIVQRSNVPLVACDRFRESSEVWHRRRPHFRRLLLLGVLHYLPPPLVT